ncbi:hypothetical protein BDV93DRAFT_194542 [Ceratobasidium sp. AG-I]|nr:hypothetical protein BDV93DRAFT_194542 [Ceratobasidium sp. AG-I]
MSFPTPPATQALPADTQPSQPGPSAARVSAPIQIGLTRLNASSRLPTPPLTQTLDGFPLDPTLFGDEDLNLDLSAPSLIPDVENPGGEAADQVNPLYGDMPPPPELPTAPGPSNSNGNRSGAEESEAGPSSVAPKARRPRRVAGAEVKPKRKRKAKASEDANENVGESDVDEAERPKRRRKSGRVKERKVVSVEAKINALEKEVAEAMEEGGDGEPLDPTTATMASLCDANLPSGRLSSKFLEKGIAYHVEDRRKRILERTAERLQKLRSSGLDPDDPRQPPPPPTKQSSPAPGTEVDEAGNTIAGPSNSNNSGRRELGASLSPSPEPRRAPGETFAETAAAPQIRFVNGEMVLDEDSQFYDRAGPAGNEDAMVVVDEADSTRFSNSASYMRKAGARGSRWTADETEMFYWCLSAFGEDYENIARYLGRTPLQCKNKTKTEDKRGNEKRITEAIKTRIPLDLEEFGRITGRDFSGPPPEIRAPILPLAEIKEQEAGCAEAKAKATSSTSTPTATPRKKGKGKGVAHPEEEEVMTLEEYERDGKDD